MSQLDLHRPIPIFPLPNCVVLPGAIQGLHIFEPRYRQMMTDELSRAEDDRWLAMALLRDGYEPHYASHHAPIHPTLCIGQITKSEPLADGRFNILLLGRFRATIEQELYDRPYRRGLLQIVETYYDLLAKDERQLRENLANALQALPPDLHKIALDITAHECDLEQVTDMLAYYLLAPQAIPAKQMILAEPRLDDRVKMLTVLLQRMSTQPSLAWPADPWSPPWCTN